jgi:hypothetical protein
MQAEETTTMNRKKMKLTENLKPCFNEDVIETLTAIGK